jgi:hypothetical protein
VYDYTLYVPTGNPYRDRLPMKLDHLTVDDIVEYSNRIKKYTKFRVLFQILVDPSFWREFFLLKGLRTISYNFMIRHFMPLKRSNSH